MNFSQRMGLEPATKPFQKNSMDTALRASLWNAFELMILSPLMAEWQRRRTASRDGLSRQLLVPLWIQFYKFPLSTLPAEAPVAMDGVRARFFNESDTPWNKVYEFVEFAGNLGDYFAGGAAEFRRICNTFLEREFSAYRFVGKTLAPITNEAEIKAIEQAAAMDEGLLRPVSVHVETALKLLADRKDPDYRNSMKESITAVEGICKIIAKNPKTTLGPALDAVAAKVKLHRSCWRGSRRFTAIPATTTVSGTPSRMTDSRRPRTPCSCWCPAPDS
jgi:hypothetical protein